MLKPCHLPRSWGHLTSCFVTISQNYSNQNNMVLALKSRHTDLWKPRNKSKHEVRNLEKPTMRTEDQGGVSVCGVREMGSWKLKNETGQEFDFTN